MIVTNILFVHFSPRTTTRHICFM